jgi:hypothetical protein
MAIAILEILLGASLLYVWFVLFRRGFDTEGKPAGFVQHERAFIWPDVTLAVLLFVSAGLLLAGNAFGERTSLVAGGMFLFLGIIDVAYDAQNGLLSAGAPGRVEDLTMDLTALVAGVVLSLAFLF